MKAVVKIAAAPASLAWQDWPDPVAGAGQVVVDIERAGICSTDVAIYNWTYKGRHPVPVPSVLGHEAAGRVSELGEQVSELSVGDRVAFQVIWGRAQARESLLGSENLDPEWHHIGASELGGVFADKAVIDAARLIRLPDTVSIEEGALLEPAAVACHALEMVSLRPGDRVCLVGPGPFGQIMCQIAKAGGASRIAAVGLADIDEKRLEVAQRCADVDDVIFHGGDIGKTADDVRRILGPEGADVVLDCGGTSESLPVALEVAAQGARVAVFGFAPEARIEPLRHIIRKGLRLAGVSAAARRHYGQALQMLSRGTIAPSRIVTHTLPLSNAAEGIELINARTATKVALTPA